MAKPSPASAPPLPRLLVVELWGLGDLALAMPFLRAAGTHARITLLAKPHAAPLLARFAPAVEHVPLHAPWTAFSGKYRLLHWPWSELAGTIRHLRAQRFDLGVSARTDPRDHLLLSLAGVRRRLGFPRMGSSALLTDALPRRSLVHRAEHWRALADRLGWPLPTAAPPSKRGNRVVIHTGAGHPVRLWPRDRFVTIAERLRAHGWEVVWLDSAEENLDRLLDTLANADRFIGNDSGPGHLAALLNVPTFTIFGPQLPDLFAPQHPAAAWITGTPCRYKPCFDRCRFHEPFCIRDITTNDAWTRISAWLTP